MRPDIIVAAPEGRPALIVEVQPRRESTPEWAAETRCRLLAEGISPWPLPFFLLVARDRLFLWKRGRPVSCDQLPDVSADAAEVLEPAMGKYPTPLETMTREGLELLVAIWLSGVIYPGPATPPPPRWLFESGLHDALRNGSIQLAEAA